MIFRFAAKVLVVAKGSLESNYDIGNSRGPEKVPRNASQVHKGPPSDAGELVTLRFGGFGRMKCFGLGRVDEVEAFGPPRIGSWQELIRVTHASWQEFSHHETRPTATTR
jgi:hypothetical protein